MKLFGFIFFAPIIAFAQHHSLCGFNQILARNTAQHQKAETLISNFKTEFYKDADSANKLIPVVVHVFHNGGAENISDAQIQSQIDVLNEDFGKLSGTAGDGAGVDTRVRFKLARLTPDGRCTNGIVRIKSALTNHKSSDRDLLSELSWWDAERYLNIYLVKSIDNGSGTLGYASFPGGPAKSDGLVILYNAFGRTGNVTSPYNKGRTATHETGHWLGLYHTFQDGCGTDLCTDGDKVCDTPPVIDPNFGCPSNRNTCHNDSPDIVDQIANYMDYTDDACKSMLSAGQGERIQATLNTIRTGLWTAENLSATGTDSSYTAPNCTVVADFTATKTSICSGNPVLFVNKSLNGAISYKWEFQGGTPDTSTVVNPSVTYANPGFYSVKLIASDSNGADTLLRTDYITVSNPPTGLSLPFYEGFEGVAFPDNNISLENGDNGITWERDTTAVAYEGSASARINNLINTNYGQADALVLPGLNLANYPGMPYLRFRWAYARSDANYSDQLVVQVSKDCGVTFSQIFTRTGSALATGPTQTTVYQPDSATTWKEAKISLNAYEAASSLIIKIINVTDGGNCLYIDKIQVDDMGVGIDEIGSSSHMLQVVPNPSSENVSISAPNLKAGRIQIQITDQVGRTVRSFSNNVLAPERPIALLHQLPAGFYQIMLNQNGQTTVGKLVVE